MVKGRFKEEQEIIDKAMAVKDWTPWPVREYVSHFLRNDMMSLQRQCGDSREALDTIQHMSKILRIIVM